MWPGSLLFPSTELEFQPMHCHLNPKQNYDLVLYFISFIRNLSIIHSAFTRNQTLIQALVSQLTYIREWMRENKSSSPLSLVTAHLQGLSIFPGSWWREVGWWQSSDNKVISQGRWELISKNVYVVLICTPPQRKKKALQSDNRYFLGLASINALPYHSHFFLTVREML